MVDVISPNLEFYEVLNAFPSLHSFLEDLHFKVQNVSEGISMYDYFENSDHMSKREVDLLVRKLNSYLKDYLKPQEIKSSDENLVLEESSEELLEEE